MMIDLKKGKLAMLLVLAVVLTVTAASSASAFLYFVQPLNNTINKDQVAVFQLTVSNPLATEDYFTISTRDVNWIVTADPASGKVPAKSDGEFLIYLKPKSDVPESNIYLVPIKVRSEQTDTFQEEGKKFAVFVGPFANIEYAPTVTPSVAVDKMVDPREKISVRLNLRNRNPKNLENLTIEINGGDFQQTFTLDLLPLEDKSTEILFGVDPLLQPGKRRLTTILYYGGKMIGESSAEYEILGYEDLKESSTTQKSLFRQDSTYVIYNNGNKVSNASKIFDTQVFERIFTSFEPAAVKQKSSDGSTVYVVSKSIGPKETFTVVEVTDYRVLVGIITAVIICAILYFVLRSPVILHKTAEPIGRTSDGLSEIKVRLLVKNRSKKQINNVRVTDVIPSIAEIKKTSHVGSMDPVNVTKGKRGTIARWEFEQLEPYEERIIAYKIESKLKLIGGIRLPNAKARFDTKKGKERLAFSNGVNMLHREDAQ